MKRINLLSTIIAVVFTATSVFAKPTDDPAEQARRKVQSDRDKAANASRQSAPSPSRQSPERVERQAPSGPSQAELDRRAQQSREDKAKYQQQQQQQAQKPPNVPSQAEIDRRAQQSRDDKAKHQQQQSQNTQSPSRGQSPQPQRRSDPTQAINGVITDEVRQARLAQSLQDKARNQAQKAQLENARVSQSNGQKAPPVFNSRDYDAVEKTHANGDGKTITYYDKVTGKKVGNEVYSKGKPPETNILGAQVNTRITSSGKTTVYDKHDNRNFETNDPNTGYKVSSNVVLVGNGIEKRVVSIRDNSNRQVSTDTEYFYKPTQFRGYEVPYYVPRAKTYVPVYLGPSYSDEIFHTALIISLLRSNQNYQPPTTGPIIYDNQEISREQYAQVQSDRSTQQSIEDYINRVNSQVFNVYNKELKAIEAPTGVTKLWRGAKKFVGIKVDELDKTATVGPNHKILIRDMVSRLMIAMTGKSPAQESQAVSADGSTIPAQEVKTIGLEYMFNSKDGSIRNKISMIAHTKVESIYYVSEAADFANKPCFVAGGQIVEPIKLSKGQDGIDDAIVKIVQSDSDIDADEAYCKGGKTVRIPAPKYVSMLSRLLEVTDDAMEQNKNK